ncbi:hypothetical protein CDAR_309021 [Caerostris darwini]|uniref:Uncharacterized protein n=1 Tax=Caerostris darwini TaxID=1538125 RepID=A0AAV4U5K9_9ARAC|nr:hypothetical protein CDAR_309021 [Caerostris darwini]
MKPKRIKKPYSTSPKSKFIHISIKENSKTSAKDNTIIEDIPDRRESEAITSRMMFSPSAVVMTMMYRYRYRYGMVMSTMMMPVMFTEHLGEHPCRQHVAKLVSVAVMVMRAHACRQQKHQEK